MPDNILNHFTDLKLRLLHEFKYLPRSLKWIGDNQLALCNYGRVEIYEVTTSSCQPIYRITTADWEGLAVRGVAASKAMPGKILVICFSKTFVYQFPSREANTEEKRYKISCKKGSLPRLICANDNIAVVECGIGGSSNIHTFTLPDFIQQTEVPLPFAPNVLDITNDHLLFGGYSTFVVRSLKNVDRNLLKKEVFRCQGIVCFGQNCNEIYTRIGDDSVILTLQRFDIEKNGTCIITSHLKYEHNEMGVVTFYSYQQMSVSSHGLIAVCLEVDGDNHVRIYKHA